jgi:hypothetical protein
MDALHRGAWRLVEMHKLGIGPRTPLSFTFISLDFHAGFYPHTPACLSHCCGRWLTTLCPVCCAALRCSVSRMLCAGCCCPMSCAVLCWVPLQDARVPLIIRAPWIKASVGQNTLAFAELIDIFPTLVDLAGLPQVSRVDHTTTTTTALPRHAAIQQGPLSR